MYEYTNVLDNANVGSPLYYLLAASAPAMIVTQYWSTGYNKFIVRKAPRRRLTHSAAFAKCRGRFVPAGSHSRRPMLYCHHNKLSWLF
jgi:hypothetical protein